MAFKRSELLTKLRIQLNEISAGFYLDTTLNPLIQDACWDFALKTECCEKTDATKSTAANTRAVAAPTGCIQVKGVGIGDAGLIKILEKAIGHVGGVTKGTPRYWYFFGGNIEFDPIPNAIALLYILYAEKATTFATDDTTTNIPDELVHIALRHALARCKGLKGAYAVEAGIMNSYEQDCARIYAQFYAPDRDVLAEFKLLDSK